MAAPDSNASASELEQKMLLKLAECEAALENWLEQRISPRWRSLLSPQDVLQQTYIDALLVVRRQGEPSEGRLQPWLRAIARNNLIDAIRGLSSETAGGRARRVSNQADPDESHIELWEQVTSHGTTPSRAANRQEAKQKLVEAMHQLPAAYRTIVQRYDLDGESVETVAGSLGCSVGAVYMRRQRALKLLQKWLASSPSGRAQT
jgi:RNA polymerase sigma factor (sigma-70 family)